MRIAFDFVESESRSIDRRAHDDEVTHFDTARLYGWGIVNLLMLVLPVRSAIGRKDRHPRRVTPLAASG
jgi:hypothetical protein